VIEETEILNELVEIKLKRPEDFLKIKETLTRIGISSKDKKLYQSCHIFHKKGKYYIVHFKELFKMDGKFSDISEEDLQRRNAIACLLEEWDLLEILDKSKVEDKIHIRKMKIISYKDKDNWELVTKYNIGKS
tara:strand:+ start:4696 stop:5094 length:399 start_codon:yes stop_codon:yes gene_type:complete